MVDQDGRCPAWFGIIIDIAFGCMTSDPESTPTEFLVDVASSVGAGRAGKYVLRSNIPGWVKPALRTATESGVYALMDTTLKGGKADWYTFFKAAAIGGALGVGHQALDKFYMLSKAAYKVGKLSMEDTLRVLATKVEADLNLGNGPVPGTLKHTAFANEVKKMFGDQSNISVKVSGLEEGSVVNTEVSFLNSEITSYGTKGSVRVDVIVYNPDGTIKAVYDYKSGGAKLTEKRIAEIRAELGVSENVPVVEIKSLPTTNTTSGTTGK